MREEVRDPERIKHILDTIEMLISARTKHTKEDLIADPIIFYGFSRVLEIIGEAVYMLTKEFKNLHPEVPWRDIERFRHVMVHGYYKVNPNIVWDVIETDIDILKEEILGLSLD